MNQKKINEAIDVFKNNVKRNPGSWNAYDSLAEALVTSGNSKDALLYYRIALSKAPDNQKNRINGIMKKLEAK
jgi:tetratricopeptide (TPR) repeat protein